MKTDPNIRPGSGPSQEKNFHKGKPKHDRFFKKKFDKPNQTGGDRGGRNPPGKQWKPKGQGGPPGRQWKAKGGGPSGDGNREGGPPGRQWNRPGGGGPPGQQWKPKGADQNGDKHGPPGKHWQPRAGQQGARKPYERNQPKSQGQRQREGGHWNKPRGGPGSAQQQHHHQQQQQQQQKHQPSVQDLDALFAAKPEKINYCLAPERLEAQQRAIKRFDKQERDADHQRKQNEKQRKHKMMTAKTKKGQPVMQGRMELLYEKVQKMVGQG